MRRPRRRIGGRFVARVRGALVRHGERQPPAKAIGTTRALGGRGLAARTVSLALGEIRGGRWSPRRGPVLPPAGSAVKQPSGVRPVFYGGCRKGS